MNTSYPDLSAKRIATATAALVFALVLGASPAMAQWKAGTTLPDLKTFKLEGDIPALSGKVVVIDFWASWCGPCKASFPVLNELVEKFGKSDFILIAVNEDEKAEAKDNFLKRHPASFTVLRDIGQKFVTAAGVESMPSSFVIDKAGKVRYTHPGFHGDKSKEQYIKEIDLLLKESAK